jgi:hypothetical protein
MARVKQLPDDVKQNCLSLVRGYARRKREYNQKRQELMSRSNDKVVTIRDREDPENDRKSVGVMLPGAHKVSRTTENIAERMLALEDHPDTIRMRAVEYAESRIGADLSEGQRKLLQKAILSSCIQGKKCPFERLHVEGMERSCFYDRRMRFLVDIAIFMDMI